MNYYRKPLGDMVLTFAIFAIVGTAAVAGGIALSQFNMVKNKLISSMESCQAVVINGIKDNLSDSALINDPAGSQTVLNGLRTDCINTAVASLGPDFQQYLLDRGNVLNDIYDNPNTIIQVNGQRIDIQVGVEANLANGFPVNFTRRSKPLNVIPSDLQRVDSATSSLDCGASCGECGVCNGATGECMPNYRVLDAGGQTGLGPYKEPRDNAEADGTYLCKDYVDTLAGQFCLANGGSIINEGGFNGCDYGNGCKYIPNYHAWNQVGDFFSGTITLRQDGTTLSTTIPVLDTSYTHVPTSMEYTRHDIAPLLHQPFGVNVDSPGDPAYAVCEAAPPANLGRRIFITSSLMTGNLVAEANSRYGTSFTNAQSRSAANFICDQHASAGGLSGTWLALLGYDDPGANARDDIAPTETDIHYYRNRSNITGRNDQISFVGPGIIGLGISSVLSVNVDEFGNHDNTPEFFIWGGFRAMTSPRGETIPRGRYFERFAGWLNNASGNCDNWTNAGATAGFGLHKRTPVYGWGQWAEFQHLVIFCTRPAHLYCVEETPSDITSW